MDTSTELDVNVIIAGLREQIGMLALEKAMLSARISDLEIKLTEKEQQ
jgi:hypothetical protein